MVGERYAGAATPLQLSDLYDAAKELSCDPIIIRALLAVETGGHGFDAQKRPLILFEPHVMWRVCAGKVTMQAALQKAGVAYPVWGTRPYPPGQDAQYQRIETATTIAGEEFAVRACSWGLGQQLAEGYARLGYTTALAEVHDAMTSERAQLFQMVRFLEKNNLVVPLAQKAWYTVGLGYNGKANAKAYGNKLATSYASLFTHSFPSWPTTIAPRVSPTSVPSIALHPARPADVSAEALNTAWLAAHPQGIVSYTS